METNTIVFCITFLISNSVMESTEWPRIGLFSGVTTHLGNYAECLRARGPGIKGQYCLAQATYNFPATIFDRPAPGWTQWPEENASVWKIIQMVRHETYF